MKYPNTVFASKRGRRMGMPQASETRGDKGVWKGARVIFRRRRLSQQSLQIDALDGLRGLAVLIVFLSHTGNAGWHLIPGVDFRGTGKSGVFLFFILSSYLLSRNQTKISETFFTWRKIWSYWARRVLRVYPLYILYIIVALGIYEAAWIPTAVQPSMSMQSGLEHLLLLDGKSVAWSIPVEFKYYVLLPFVSWLFLYAFRINVMLMMLMYFVMVSLSIYLFPASEALVNDIRVAPYLVIFLTGSLLGVIHACDVKLPEFFRSASPFLLVLAIVGWAYAAPSINGWINGETAVSNLSHKWFVYFSLLWGGVLMLCLYGVSWISKIFEFFPLQFLGQISFSFYLWHLTVIGLTKYFFPELMDPFKAWVALIGSIAVSTITYHFVERPMSTLSLKRMRYSGVVKTDG